MEPNSSTTAQNESQQETTQAGDTPFKIQDFKVFASASTTLFLLIIGEEKTYIDYDDLANFLSKKPEVANRQSFPKLQKVLGTEPSVYSHIEWQLNANLISIAEAISKLLCDWVGRMRLYEATVSRLCYGSPAAVSTGTVITDGLENNGFLNTIGMLKQTNVL
jgi:hypothetical protein